MARQDLEPAERDQEPLTFSAIVECPDCHLEFEQVFEGGDDVFETEDLIDPPQAQTVCPDCGADWMAEYTGWTVHQDAG